MTTPWTTEEEAECLKLKETLDQRIATKKRDANITFDQLHNSYLLLRNWTFLSLITSATLLIFRVTAINILLVQTFCLLILMVFFGRFEFSGLNGQWLRALQSRDSWIDWKRYLEKRERKRDRPWKDVQREIFSAAE
jgi:hypothetical protein